MSGRQVLVGDLALHPPEGEVRGAIIKLDGDAFYRIDGLEQMVPFFTTVVSDADHWMFLSSTGALTAGRRNPERSLFPYVAEDKIHDSVDVTGPKTLLLVDRGGRASLWEPFSPRYAGAYRIRRFLYKSVLGSAIVFGEHNLDLGLTFRYRWAFSHRFGFVRRARLENDGAGGARIRVLDGIQNLLPAGVHPGLQMERSNLVDAYKKSELEPGTGLGIFSLSSIPVDRPEASEALRATTVWSTVPPKEIRLLSSRQLDAFRTGASLAREMDIRGTRGAYFVSFEEEVPVSGSADWYVVADVHQSSAAVASLVHEISVGEASPEALEADIDRGSRELRAIIGAADGFQATADPLNDARHVSNVLFNVLRGGIYADGYVVDRDDLHAFVSQHNRRVAAAHESLWDQLPERVDSDALSGRIADLGDPQLARLCAEYLPLTFSRRHGDPSRPWNDFSIEGRRPDGSRALSYEGNWRDIFQNWEALSVSYPGFLEGVIARFLNASTLDGHNPYRIMRGGIEWEVLDSEDPWSCIGYWGDHQVIYLLKLLELSRAHRPASLRKMLANRQFAYANVPYRIRGYSHLLSDPRRTIRYDAALEREIATRVAAMGADGRLVLDRAGRVRLVTLTEKLLVLLLAKLANFIPGAGIWMNTQRPEWNDANNALVGHGVSVVTLCHLRRYLAFVHDLYTEHDATSFPVAAESAAFARSVARTLAEHEGALGRCLDDRTRKAVLDGVGRAGEQYREAVYDAPEGGCETDLGRDELLALFQGALRWVDQSIRENRRSDGLYHGYNLINSIQDDALSIGRLPEMLEGQVAVLTAGVLSGEEVADLLDTLRHSDLYREDQHSYLLYPDQVRPLFLERNTIDASRAARSRFLRRLLESGDVSLVERDAVEHLHFAGDIRNGSDVTAALDVLKRNGHAELVDAERESILGLFEDHFSHRTFTGRSFTFYGYEGLGAIYWHMVSKLLLAVAEAHEEAARSGAGEDTLARLATRYYDIRSGLDAHKSPAVHGAFPTDPYSHTPGGGGARQPGLTGQVKEDILARWAELGVRVAKGRIEFRPILLRLSEFSPVPHTFRWVDFRGGVRWLELEAGTLAFTYCQTPVVYHAAESGALRVVRQWGTEEMEGLVLPEETSSEIFRRTGTVERIDVFLRPGLVS